MSEQYKKDLSVSGSASIGGGVYGTVKVSGSARADEDITCDMLKVSGSGHFSGNITTGECRVSGSAHFNSALSGKEIHVSGSCHALGDVEAENIHVSGSMKIGGVMRGGNGRFSGSVTASKDIEFEDLSISGIIHVAGLLNADKLHIILGGSSDAQDIGGDDIRIERSESGKRIMLFFETKWTGSLTAQNIEGTNVYLENTKCDVVRGKDVIISSGCDIKRVEYENTIKVSDDARVGERIKL